MVSNHVETSRTFGSPTNRGSVLTAGDLSAGRCDSAAETRADDGYHAVSDTTRQTSGPGYVTSPAVTTALGPLAVTRQAERIDGSLTKLTQRQREVLMLLAEGRSNAGIAKTLFITEKSVVEHVSKIYGILRLPQTGREHRRVLAVLRYLSG